MTAKQLIDELRNMPYDAHVLIVAGPRLCPCTRAGTIRVVADTFVLSNGIRVAGYRCAEPHERDHQIDAVVISTSP